MWLVVLVLGVLVVTLFSQVRELRTRLEAVERFLREVQPPAESPPVPEAVGALNRPADPRVSPWPAQSAIPMPVQPAVQSPASPADLQPADPPPAQGIPAPFPGRSLAAPTPMAPAVREPVNVQHWLTRAGIAATLLGAAYVLAVLEAQGHIGAWWRVLAGLLLGGWLSWLAGRAARSGLAGSAGRSLWAAEALGSLGISVALLTLTFAARAGGGSELWAALLTVLTLASGLLARRWGGVATPLVALVALVLALPSAQGVVSPVPAAHLWGLTPLGLACMVWALAALSLLPLLVRTQTSQGSWRSALPGAAALLLLALLSGLSAVGGLAGGRPGEQAGVALLTSALVLAGVLLRRNQAEAGSPGRLDEALRSVVGTLALGTLAGACCRLTGLDLRWAAPLAVLPPVALLRLARSPRSSGGWALDPQVLSRVTLSAALASALGAVGAALALHSGDAGREAWLPALAALAGLLLAAWGLNPWSWHGVRVVRPLLVLGLCAPAGLLFGLAGVAMPLAVWLARRQAGQAARSWGAVSSWHPASLAVWALFALPLLSSGVLAGTEAARLGETALLLLGSAGLVACGLTGVLRPQAASPELRPWLLATLLAWSGAWLLAAVLGRVQGEGTEDFGLTTPALALLGGWLLFRAQPARPGGAAWKWNLWLSGAALLVFALLRVLLSDLSASDPLIRAAGLLGAGLVTVLAGVRFPPPSRS